MSKKEALVIWGTAKYKDGISLDRVYPFEEISKLEIPDELDGLPVIRIGEKAFQNLDYLKEVKLPVTVEEIGDLCFDGCTKLKRLILPSADTVVLGEDVFRDCDKLKIYKDVIKIEDCGKKEVTDIDFICDHCGAEMEINKNRTKVTCPYCNSKRILWYS